MNQPPRPGNGLAEYKLITDPGHPSFKKEGIVMKVDSTWKAHCINTNFLQTDDVLKFVCRSVLLLQTDNSGNISLPSF